MDTTFAGAGTVKVGFGGGYDVANAAAVQAGGKLIPAGHGVGGVIGSDEAIVRWVEKGKAPKELIARGAKNRMLALFPYPEVAKYKGRGSTDQAGNFESSLPKSNN